MARRMTVVFDDEDLYTALKVEAARSHRPAKDIVAEAVQAWLGSQDGVGAFRQPRRRRLAGARRPDADPVVAHRRGDRTGREATTR